MRYLTFSKRNVELGFTLVELILVVALIGILASVMIVLINPNTQFQRTRDSQRKNDLAQLQRALEQYYNDNGAYPTHQPGTFVIRDGNTPYSWGNAGWTYFDPVPKDPVSSQKYVYFSPSTTTPPNQSYYLYAHLENIDSSVCIPGGAECLSIAANGIPAASCGLACNFAVTSGNVSP